MLPAAARVRTRSDHRLVAQAGRRVRRGSLVLTVVTAQPPAGAASERVLHQVGAPGPGARAGVIVGRRVGGAVVRNRVKRRLREQLRSRLDALSPGSLVVVRALPGAERASSLQLGRWLDGGLRSPFDRGGDERPHG